MEIAIAFMSFASFLDSGCPFSICLVILKDFRSKTKLILYQCFQCAFIKILFVCFCIYACICLHVSAIYTLYIYCKFKNKTSGWLKGWSQRGWCVNICVLFLLLSFLLLQVSSLQCIKGLCVYLHILYLCLCVCVFVCLCVCVFVCLCTRK